MKLPLLLVWLAGSLLPQFANAGGCPPWLPCCKYQNLIIPDSDSYSSAVNSVSAVAPPTATPTPSPVNSNIENELLLSTTRISNAQKDATRLQKDLRNSTGSVTVIDEAPAGTR